ncbi:MAG TPA: segregation/condensation protein A [Egibacteraceae bacterium]|nr:segregation/condensation protein A [Egibacteraceae bacterium]
MATTYHVTVGSFEGPFDLLLHLIARRKVEIYDIPIAQITDDYLAVLRQLDELDLEVATEFLVVAATLIELKAARLLPSEDDPELEELALEARDLLYARLLDYRTFKEAAGWVSERMEAFTGYAPRELLGRDGQLHVRQQVAVALVQADLARLALRALTERPEPVVDLSHVQPVRMTVREAAGMVMDELDRAGGRATFRELTGGCRHPIEVIVHFLALLELYKLGHVELEQAASFGEIGVELRADEPWHGSVFATMEAYDARAAEDPEDAEVPKP